MKKVLSVLLVIVMAVTSIIAFVPAIEASAAKTMTVDELKEQIVYSYEQAKKLSGRSSFNGYCGTMVGYQLKALGVNTDLWAVNGNDHYDHYVNMNKTSTGYKVNCYPASKGTIEQILNTITKNGTVDAYNILVGFQKGSTSEAGQKYGHVLLINGIIDGTVYFCESANRTIDGIWRKEGTVISCSISTFSQYYHKSCTQFEGIVHFGWPCDCEEYNSDGTCSNCGTPFNYESTKTSVSGIYAITKKISPSTTPYATTQDTSYTFKAGTAVELLGKYKNAWDNVWYKVSYGNGKTGYLYESYVSKVATTVEPSHILATATVQTEVMSLPCSAKTNSASYEVAILKKGDTFDVTQVVTNIAGNYWYKVKTAAGDEGWVWCEDTKVNSLNKESNKIIIGSDMPTTHTAGKTRHVDYKLQTSYSNIKNVTGAIYNGTATSGTAVYKKTMNIGSKYVNLYDSDIDDAMKFASLSAGKQYTFVISATLVYKYYDYTTDSLTTYEYPVSKSWTFTVQSSGSSSGSTTITPATITEGTYYFSNDDYKMYMISDTSGKNNIGASNGTVSTKYQFNVVKDGSYYKIVPVDGKNGYVLNSYWASGSTTKNGDEVTLYKNTSDPSQRWVFEKCGDGYLIHPADATHLSITRDGSKLYVKTTTKEANQMWKLESPECSHTYDNACDTTCNKCGATRSITHTYSNTCDSSCNVCGATRSVSHSYSSSYNSNSSTHWKTCTKCGATTTASEHDYSNACDTSCNTCGYTRTTTHTYSNGCDTSCNVCGATRTTNHSFNTDYSTNQNEHWYSCTVCGEKHALQEHKYSYGCDRTCDICGYYRSWGSHDMYVVSLDDVAMTMACRNCSETRYITHNYDNDCDESCAFCGHIRIITHTYSNDCDNTCNVCGATRSTSHKYDNDCDTSCNICGATRTVSHNYGTSYSNNQNGHWHICTVCGAKGTVENHTPGAPATETTPQTCTKCGYVIQGALGHTHNYPSEYEKDVNSHWNECSCGAKSNINDHIYDNGCDTSCNVCGYARTTQHVYSHNCDTDCNECGYKRSIRHTYEHGCDPTCSVCGDVRETEHVFDDDQDKECNECGFTRELNTPDDGQNPDDGQTPAPDTGNDDEDNNDGKKGIDTTTVIIVSVAAVVTILGLTLIFRKRR